MDAFWKHYKLKKSDIKATMYDSIYMKCPDRQRHRDRNQISGCQTSGSEQERIGNKCQWVQGFILGCWNYSGISSVGCPTLWLYLKILKYIYFLKDTFYGMWMISKDFLR